MLELKQLKDLQDKAYESGYDTRLKAADDMLFAWVTQWDDSFLEASDLQTRFEFNIIRKAQRQILTDLVLNPIQVDFDPVDDTFEEAADIMDGAYRADMRNNKSQEAKKNANQECVVCGVGAWRLKTEYRSNQEDDDRQRICRVPIYEANNRVFWDPNAKLMDKSDARYVAVLEPFTSDGYEQLCEDLGVECEHPSSFSEPEQSYVFPWLGSSDEINVVYFYHRELKKVKYYTFSDEFGNRRIISEDDLPNEEDSLAEDGYDLDSEKDIKRFVVTEYIASGSQILSSKRIAGEHLPVVPQYGERQFVEGEEHYEGIVRLAKDPQRLRNFQMSYLADIVSRSPRRKPIFTDEQISGYEDMYQLGGADNNYPYLKQNHFDSEGNPLPIGAVGEIPNPDVPPALMQSIMESRQAVDDVASPGLPQDITDPDLSGKAVMALQKRLDMQSYTYQDHHKFAMRRDGEIYASMFRDIMDSEQEITLVQMDGTSSREVINKSEIDWTTMESKVVNDVRKMQFEVYADIGPSFESVKQQTREELKELINGMPPGTPIHSLLMNKYLMLLDGADMDDVRDYARQQSILAGFMKPQTPEEEQMLQQAQQNQQPDPNAQLAAAEAQARMMEGQAAIQNERNDAQKIAIDQFKAETDRQFRAQQLIIEAKKVNADISNKQVESANKLIESRMRMMQGNQNAM